jgi:microcompartment protein CcmK/EutM
MDGRNDAPVDVNASSRLTDNGVVSVAADSQDSVPRSAGRAARPAAHDRRRPIAAIIVVGVVAIGVVAWLAIMFMRV